MKTRTVKRITLMYTYGKDIYEGGLTVVKVETLGRNDRVKDTVYQYSIRQAGTENVYVRYEFKDYKECRTKGLKRFDYEYFMESEYKRRGII